MLQAQSVATGASYLPSGPLSTLTLGNGTTETRLHDGRYTPTAILFEGPAPRSWLYETDPVGNILQIQEHEGCAELPVELSGLTIPDVQALTTCSEITADATTVTGTGDLTLTAGTRIAFGDGFQVDTGGRLVAGTDSTGLGQTITRTYTYQDFHYFLDTATGPWGTLAWTYDRIGNRLTETTNGATDTYTYLQNAATGNTALLTQIQLGAGGTRDYSHGPAGHLTQVAAGANVIDFTSDAEGRLSQLDRLTEQAPFSYDGRSYLRTASDATSGDLTKPTYDSAGLLHALRRINGGVEERLTYLHFAGRPVAQLKTDAAGSTLTWLTTDHLGTPVLATDDVGSEVWDANYSPFGTDLDEGLPGGALANEMYLRFPGQWDDGRWGAADLGAEVFYNVHRWYLPGVGRYGRGDPLENLTGQALFSYTRQRPTAAIDSLGLVITFVDPRLRPFLECALQSSRAQTGFNFFASDSEPWEIRVHEPRQRNHMGPNGRLMLRRFTDGVCTGIECSTVDPPGFFRPGQFWINPGTGTCEEIVGALTHELDERSRSIVSGRPHQEIHYEIPPAQNHPGAEKVCPSCCAVWPNGE